MKELFDLIQGKRGFLSSKAATNDEIKSAEQQLSLAFSDEYKEYLLQYGEVSFFGHELTGLTTSKRLNVVDVTMEEKELNSKVPADLYVIEQANIDGIVIWQSKDGKIYKSVPGDKPVLIYESLADYVNAI